MAMIVDVLSFEATRQVDVVHEHCRRVPRRACEGSLAWLRRNRVSALALRRFRGDTLER